MTEAKKIADFIPVVKDNYYLTPDGRVHNANRDYPKEEKGKRKT